METVEQVAPNTSTAATFSEEEWSHTPVAVQEAFLALLLQVQHLEAMVAELTERVNRNSRNSSQPPSSDGPEVPRKGAKRSQRPRQRGGQPGHPGTHRALVPPEELSGSSDVKPTTCAQCGAALSGTDPAPQRHQVIEIPPIVAEIFEYRLHTLCCEHCGAETRASLPEGVPQGAFGPRLQAVVSALSGRYHLSKRNAQALLADFFGVELSLGSISALEQRTSEILRAPVTEAREYIREQPVVHMDETGWKESNQKAWLWTAATPEVTVFLVRNSRGAKVAKEMLGETFAGIVNSDRWSAYNWLDVLARQLCWAHLIRDFQTFVERGADSQRIGEALLAQVEAMFAAWHTFRAGHTTRARFQDTMRPIQQQVAALLREGTTSTHTKTAGTCRDILKREGALWTFVHTDGVEPTNNFAERQVRPGVIWRKLSFGSQSHAGSRFVERIMTVATTLQQQQRNLLDYLTQACASANFGNSPPSLLPLRATT